MNKKTSNQTAHTASPDFNSDIHAALYESLMQNPTLGFWVLDKNTRFLQVNDTYLHRSGYTRQEFLACTISDVEAKESPEETAVHTQNIQQQGHHLFESVHRTKAGQLWPVEVHATFADGRFFAIIQDITQRKKIESQLRQKSDALEHSINGFDIVSADGKFLYVNRAYLTMWGYDSLDEVVGTSPVAHCADPNTPAYIIQNLEAHGTYSLVFTAKRKDGSTFDVMMVAQKVIDEDGTVTYSGTSIDITALLQARHSLNTERARLRNLLDTIPDLVWIKDPEGIYLGCNHAFEKLVGVPEAELLGKTDYDFFDTDVADFFRAHDRKAMLAGKPSINEEWLTFAADGRTILAETIKTPTLDSDGNLLGVLGIARDITDHNQLKEALRRSQAQVSGILSSALDAIVSMDESYNVVFFNAAAEEMFGYTAAETIGQPLTKLLPAHYRKIHASHVQAFHRSDKTQQILQGQDNLVGLRANGEEFPVDVNVSHVTVDGKTFYNAIIRDITERKLAEQALRNSEERLDLALKGADLGLWDWDFTTGAVVFNERWAEMLGYALDELEPHVSTWETLVHPEDKPFVWQMLNAHLDGRIDTYETVHRMRTKFGNYKWILDRGRVLARDKEGKPLRAVGTHLDITDRKLAEDALRTSEETLQLFINHAPAALAMFDRDMRYLSASHKWATIYDLNWQEIIGNSHYDLFPEIPDRWKEIHQRGLAGEVARMEEDLFIRQNGQKQWLRWEIRPWYTLDNTVGGVVIFFEDITEQKAKENAIRELQEILAQAESIAKIGSWKWNLTTNALTWSAEMYNLFGVEPTDNDLDLSQIIQTRIHPDDIAAVEQSNINVLEAHKPTPLEYRVVLPDGTLRWIWAEGRLIEDSSKQATSLMGYAQDITERKQAEQAIRESEERYHSTLDNMLEGCQIIGFDWRYLYVNDSVAKHGRTTTENLLGKTMMEAYPGIETTELFTILNRCMSDRTAHSLTNKFEYGDGTYAWFDLSIQPVPEGLFILSIDITERKEAVEALRISEERLRVAVKNARFIPAQVDKEARYQWIFNPHPDFESTQIIGKRDDELEDSEGTKALTALKLRVIESGVGAQAEISFVRSTGTHTYLFIIEPLQNSEGAVIGATSAAFDITEQKETLEALRQSEARFSQAFHLSPAGLSLTRADGTLLDVNESYEKLTGYSREELLNQDATLLNIFTLEQRVELRQRMQEAGGRLQQAELSIKNKSGEQRYVLYSVEVVAIKGEPYALTLAFDITKRRQMEIALKEMATNMASAQAMTHSGSWEVQLTPDLKFIEPHIWSDECFRIFGLEPGSQPITGEEFYQLVHPEDREGVRKKALEVFQASGRVRYEYRIIRPDGTLRSVRDRSMVIRDEQTNQPIKLVGFIQDITERKVAEATIGQLNQRMALILNSAGEGIYGADNQNRISFVNPAMAQMLGWEPAELVGQDAHEVFHHSHPDGTPYPGEECEIRTAVFNGNAYHNEHDVYWHKDSTPIFVDYTSTPIYHESVVVGSVTLVRNITQRKKAAEEQAILEDQLRQAQKMESIGRLAGGVAHDFNNQLAIIKLYSDLMRHRMSDNDPLLPKLEQIRQAVDRSADLTRQLLAFSRKQVLQPVRLNMNDLVSNLQKMLARLIGEEITLSTNLQPDLWPVMADPGQLEQVIMNLIINARDAMTSGGMITIETRNVHLAHKTIPLYQDLPGGPYIILAISDTGLGMDEATRHQIFEPFFTTKQPGKGTGLGLATVHGIVNQSGGGIYVYSEPNVGTTFKIYLPVSQGTSEQMTPLAGGETAVHGSETILLVEDETALRTLMQETLEEIGYTVLAAATGSTALHIAQQHPQPLHLLLTDVVLPEMGGQLLSERITAVHPQTKVLFISGYMDDAILRHGVLMADVNFLPKPFSRSALAAKVRDVLDK